MKYRYRGPKKRGQIKGKERKEEGSEVHERRNQESEGKRQKTARREAKVKKDKREDKNGMTKNMRSADDEYEGEGKITGHNEGNEKGKERKMDGREKEDKHGRMEGKQEQGLGRTKERGNCSEGKQRKERECMHG